MSTPNAAASSRAPGSSPPPRLGIVISMFPELHETFILRELVALERRGIDFDLFSLQHPRDPITLEDAIRLSEQRTHYAPLIDRASLGALLRTLARRAPRVLRAAFDVMRVGRDRPDQVLRNLAVLPIAMRFADLGERRGITHWHGHWANVPTTLCWYLKRIHGASFSAAIHGEDIFTANRFLSRKLNDAAFTVVCSGYFQKHLQSALALDAPQRVHLNYHGLDPRILERAAEAAACPTPASHADAGPERWISVGRLVPTKGHDELIALVGHLIGTGRDISLQIVGSGPEQASLEGVIREHGLAGRITLTGPLAFDEVIDRMLASDVFCLLPRMIPGQPPDGIPNVIAEAMALGLPVISRPVSAIPELVEDGVCGVLLEAGPERFEAGVRKLQALLGDADATQRMAQAARRRVAGLFDQEANIDELIGHFEHYLPGRAIGYAPAPVRDEAHALGVAAPRGQRSGAGGQGAA